MQKQYKFQALKDPFSQNKFYADDEQSQLSIDLTATFFDISTRNTSYKQENNNLNQQVEGNNQEFLNKSTKTIQKINEAKLRLEELNNLIQKSGIYSNEDDNISNLMDLIKENLKKKDEKLEFYQRQKNSQIKQRHFLNKDYNQEDKKDQGHQELSIKQEFSEQNYYPQRQQQMKNIQKMLNDIGQAFQRLGTIIKLHEVMIDRIDRNTDDSLNNVEKTRKSLADTHKQVSSGRGLMIKIFFIMIVFATVYIIFLV